MGNEIKKGKKRRYKRAVGWERHSYYEYQMFQGLPSRSFLDYRNLVFKLPATSAASPGNLLEMEVPWPHPEVWLETQPSVFSQCAQV